MKHFIIVFFALVLLLVWMYILNNIVGLNLTQLEHDNKILYFLLVICPTMCLMVVYTYYDEKSKETPKEKTKTENLKTDNPEDNEIITVTEIKGERNIIVVKIIVFIIGLVLTGIFTFCGSIIGLLPLIFAIMYCFKTNDKNKD